MISLFLNLDKNEDFFNIPGYVKFVQVQNQNEFKFFSNYFQQIIRVMSNL